MEAGGRCSREVEVKLESMRPHLRKQKFEIGTLSVPSVKALPPFTEEDTDLVSNCVPFRFLSIVPRMKRTSPVRVLCEPLEEGHLNSCCLIPDLQAASSVPGC